MVPLSDHVGPVDPAPVDRRCTRRGFDPAGLAAGGEVFAMTHAFIASPIGVLLLFGWSVAFFYHLCSGIRHLAWDAGYGFEIRSAYRSGYAVLAATALLTVLAWLYVLLA
jgi:succinate dehydrogenase / fumarate reductase, cytochrome b subunit